MPSILVGIGTALPEPCLNTDLFIAHAKKISCRTERQERVLEELYRRTEIKRRASVLSSRSYGSSGEQLFREPAHETDSGPTTAARMQCYNNEAGELGVKASHRALAAAQITADQFTHIITVSCTGFYAPGFDIEIINRLGLPRTVQRTHVGFMGCHGAMNALRVAQAFADRQPSARILVCAVELCSLHFQYGWAPDKLVANSLFSDGAAALIMAGDESAVKTRCGLHKGSGSVIVEDTADAMRWYIGDNGFQMQLSSQVPNIVANTLANWLSSWLRQYDIAVGDITNWAVHPGGPRILDAVEQCLQLPESALLASRTVFEQCGNMSSPTVLFIIEELLRAKASGPCVVLGFGPGLTIEAALLLLD